MPSFVDLIDIRSRTVANYRLLRAVTQTLDGLIETETEKALRKVAFRSAVGKLAGIKDPFSYSAVPDLARAFHRLSSPDPDETRYADLKYRFRPFVWSSFFVSAYSILEHCLLDYSDSIAHFYQMSDVHEESGNGVVRSRAYLAEVAGVEIPNSWGKLTWYPKVRNCLTHAGGRVADSTKAKSLLPYVERERHLSLDARGYLQIGQEYVLTAIDSMESFVVDLDVAVKLRTDALFSQMYAKAT